MTEDDAAKDGAVRKGPQRGAVEQGPKTNADLEHGPPPKGGPLRKTNQAKQGQDNGTL